jgi:peptidylprolyl isomerase
VSKQKSTNNAGAPASNTAAYVAALIIVVVLVLIGFSLGGGNSNATTAESDMAAVPTIASEATVVTDPVMPANTAKQYDAAPPMTIDTAKKYTATITTPRGDIVIALRPDLAPQTVNSFVFLARDGYYDGLTWHRVIAGFMAQGGDPTGTGAGGPGYTVPGEFTDQVSFDRPGIVAMARPGNDVDGNGSQFFITTAPAQYLDQQYTIFGEVIAGQEIVDGIPLRDPMAAVAPGESMLAVTITEE